MKQLRKLDSKVKPDKHINTSCSFKLCDTMELKHLIFNHSNCSMYHMKEGLPQPHQLASLHIFVKEWLCTSHPCVPFSYCDMMGFLQVIPLDKATKNINVQQNTYAKERYNNPFYCIKKKCMRTALLHESHRIS